MGLKEWLKGMKKKKEMKNRKIIKKEVNKYEVEEPRF